MKNIGDLVPFLLDVLRGRTGRWDVIKDATKHTGDTVRLIAVILALAVNTGALASLAWFLTRR